MKLVPRSALALVVVASAVMSGPAWAVRPVMSGASGTSGTLGSGARTPLSHRTQPATHDEIASTGGLDTASGPSARRVRAIRAGQPPLSARRAWRRFTLLEGDGFVATWDDATGLPSRIFGRGIAAPGSVADSRAAEVFAREILVRHRALLAPGTADADLIVVSNQQSDGLRVVGLAQHRDGMRVLGAQVSFRFKNDRLIAIGSEAIPDLDVTRPAKQISDGYARERARVWMTSEGLQVDEVSGHADDTIPLVEGPFVLPIVGEHGVVASRVVLRTFVGTHAPAGRWAVYVDASTGDRVARQQTLLFEDAQVLLHVPFRSPFNGYQDYPALDAKMTVAGVAQTSTDDGKVSLPGAAATEVIATVQGPKVKIVNAAGTNASKTFSIAGGGSATWDGSTDAELDAQLSSFVHAHEVKAYVAGIKVVDGLDKTLVVNDNQDDVCNAYFNPDDLSLNFFKAGAAGPDTCENTGRIADVVYHEFGHWYHYHSIIEGVGNFDGALSEGVSDFLCGTITGDSGMGRGFFFNNEALRELDPQGSEYHWPEDLDGEVHDDGRIIGGTLWDLRKALVVKYGETDGVALANRLYQAGISSAVDIPSMYPEVLAADDDDGNLENGTPDSCEIATAFGAHGLRSLTVEPSAISVVPPTQAGFVITTKISGLFEACDGAADATVAWHLRRDPTISGTLAMTGDAAHLTATIPSQAAGEVVQYQIVLHQPSGQLTFPDNAADPFYEFYVGALEDIYCTGFETDPSLEGWTHGLTSGTNKEGADDWTWGLARGDATNGDAPDAFEGTHVFGNDLSQKSNYDGLYQPNITNFALSPAIDVTGFETVRLQYRRWLGVEDRHFDKATIYANDDSVWTNFDSNQGDNSSTQHIDREWRFQDVDLTAHVKDGKIQVKYEIASDGGLQLGGWSLDAFCIRGARPNANPGPICGDSMIDDGEECDSGAANSDTTADACRATCKRASCGDHVTDSNETCDDGNVEAGDGCSATCTLEGETPGAGGAGGTAGTSGASPAKNGVKDDNGCGCRVPSSSPSRTSPALALLGLALAALRTRKRR